MRAGGRVLGRGRQRASSRLRQGDAAWVALLLGSLLAAVLSRAAAADAGAATAPPRTLDRTYRPPPIWGCEEGLPPGAFHVVIATYAPEPTALVPWIWNLGLTGAEIWIYHRLEDSDPRLAAAAAVINEFAPYPCGSRVILQRLLPNKGREAAVYMAHIVRHYAAPPEGLVLVHDHGPAARHSLCGPFFRRVRGYYAGIREQRAANGLAAAGGGGRALLEEEGSSTGALLARFANRVVSLSSGCQENWLKGCCALLVCVEDGEQPGFMSGEEDAYMAHRRSLQQQGSVADEAAGGGGGSSAWGGGNGLARRPFKKQHERCPFKSSRCLANASAMSRPPSRRLGIKSRWIYMHGAGGLYDTRYENLVVLHGETPEAAAAAALAGLTNQGFGPLSLVRYASAAAVETVRAATSSSRVLDYPEGVSTRTKQETFAELGRILQAHDFPNKKTPGNFKSCCASLMLRPHHIHHWPLSMYEQMLSYTLDGNNTYHASLAVSHHGWAMWAGAEVGPSDLLRYFEVDLALVHIRGCPGWRMVAA